MQCHDLISTIARKSFAASLSRHRERARCAW
jgi:hypothetical protein